MTVWDAAVQKDLSRGLSVTTHLRSPRHARCLAAFPLFLAGEASEPAPADDDPAASAPAQPAADPSVAAGAIVAVNQKPYEARYFMMKSFNHENIAKSIENGVWATQAHNEVKLNDSFYTSDNVRETSSRAPAARRRRELPYLCCRHSLSCRSFPGCLRIAPARLRFARSARCGLPPHLSLTTDRQRTAPQHHARLTFHRTQSHNPRYPQVYLIFSVNQSGHFQGYARMVTPIHGHRSAWTNQMSYGGTFGVQWECLCDLPFSRTLHLHNPWNEGKPVKIARDGQARARAEGSLSLRNF